MKPRNLHYYVLNTLFPLLGYLDDQHSEFLESWIAYLESKEFPNLIEYYKTIGTGALLREENTTIKECTLLKDIKNFMYLTQLHFSEDTPNQILHMLSTLILWSRVSTLILVNILPYMISWPSHLKKYCIGIIT